LGLITGALIAFALLASAFVTECRESPQRGNFERCGELLRAKLNPPTNQE
jgi:hypothetical protein